jgi:hypothetical protein
MAAFQRFGNPSLYVDDFAEIFLSMKEKLGVGQPAYDIDKGGWDVLFSNYIFN